MAVQRVVGPAVVGPWFDACILTIVQPRLREVTTMREQQLLSWKQVQYGLMAIAVCLLITATPALAEDGGSGFNPQQLLVNALEWIKGLGPVGSIAFIGIYIIATVAFLPGSILTLGAGFIFGVIQGSVLVFFGATAGATLAFLVGRYLARAWVSRKIEGNQQFAAVDRAVGKEGLKIVLLLRLSPVFPFNVLNYGLGLTGVSLKDYVLASVGMIPGTVMYVYLGSLVGDLATLGAGEAPSNPVVTWAIRIIGLLATVAVTLYVTRVARKALAEAVPETEAEQPLST